MDSQTRRRLQQLYAAAAPEYDGRTTAAGDAFRVTAIDRLDLRPGDTVLDAGCGTGLAFAPLLERVGPEGRVVGIDVSAEMLALARERVAGAGWDNVELREGAVQEVELPRVDAVLILLADEALRSAPAVERLRAAAPGGRVAAAGMKWARHHALNVYVRWHARHYVTSFDGYERPWRDLEQVTDQLEVEEFRLGTSFLAWGRFKESPPAR